jgi:hypothetical protein
LFCGTWGASKLGWLRNFPAFDWFPLQGCYASRGSKHGKV